MPHARPPSFHFAWPSFDPILPPPPLPLLQEVGTSFSAAYVAGVAGLVLAAQNYSGMEGELDMRDVKDAILDGADELPQLAATLADGQQLVAGGRRLNAYNTLAEYFDDSSNFPELPAALAGKKPQPPPPSPRPPSPQARMLGLWVR